MLQNILLNLWIGSSILELRHIHILQRELHPYFLRVDLTLGKQDNRLHDGIQKKSVHPVDHAAPQALRDRINDLRNATGNRGSR